MDCRIQRGEVRFPLVSCNQHLTKVWCRGNANDESLVANSEIDAWWEGAKEELVKYGGLPKELGGNRRSRSPVGYAGMDEEIVWDE